MCSVFTNSTIYGLKSTFCVFFLSLFYVFLGLAYNVLFVVSFCTLHPLIQLQHLLEDPLPECIYQKLKRSRQDLLIFTQMLKHNARKYIR